MKINKIKYRVAVAVTLIATAFCGCGADDEEIISLESAVSSESVERHPGDTEHAASEPVRQEEPAGDGADGSIKVYVCGAVNDPDVYTLSPDVRLIDAVNAAGGFTDDAGESFLNLASALRDGQKVYIPTKSEIEEALALDDGIYGSEVNITTNSPGIRQAGSEDNSGIGTGGLVDINHADRQTLMTLPGIGQSKADKIIAYRDANGGFSSIEDIMLVGGIKEGMFNKIKDSICVR